MIKDIRDNLEFVVVVVVIIGAVHYFMKTFRGKGIK